MLRPRTRFTLRVIFGGLVGLTWLPKPARAQAPAPSQAEAILIDYRADARCPSAKEFQDRVFARTRTARPAQGGETARTFVVAINSDAGGFRGSLSIREDSGLTLARTVADPRCEEVAEALALSTVLAIDPSPAADSSPAPAGASAAGSDGSKPEQAAAGSNKPPPENSQRPEAAAAAAPGAEPAETSDGSHAPSFGRSWSLALLLGADLQSTSSPGVSVGGSGAFEARPPAGSPIGSFGAMVSYLKSFPEPVASASATFQLVLVRPSICVFPLRPSHTLRVMPCLAAELGIITGKGADIEAPRSEQRFWGALQLPLRLELDLSESWLVQLEASLVVPTTRYRFVFLEPKTSIYEVPPLGFAAGLRIGARL